MVSPPVTDVPPLFPASRSRGSSASALKRSRESRLFPVSGCFPPRSGSHSTAARQENLRQGNARVHKDVHFMARKRKVAQRRQAGALYFICVFLSTIFYAGPAGVPGKPFAALRSSGNKFLRKISSPARKISSFPVPVLSMEDTCFATKENAFAANERFRDERNAPAAKETFPRRKKRSRGE